MNASATQYTFGGRLIFWIFLVLLMLAPFHFVGEVGSVQLAVYSFLIWAILLIGLVRLTLARGRLRFRPIPYFGLWLLYLLTVLVGFALGSDNLYGPAQALWALFRNAELLLVYPIAVQLINNERCTRAMLTAILLGLCVSALFGIAQTLSDGRWFSGLSLYSNQRYLGLFYYQPYNSSFEAWQHHAPFFRAHGSASSPNLFAALLNIGLAISGGLLLVYSSRIRTLSWIIIPWMLFLLTLSLTLSRAGWVAAIAAFTALALVQFRPRLQTILKYGAILLLLIMVVLISSSWLPEQLRSRIESIRNPFMTSEVQSRVEVWQIAINTIRQNPLVGIGSERISGALLQTWGVAPPDISPHNIYLTAAYQYGLPNLFLLMIFWLLLLLNGIQLAWRGNSLIARGVGLGSIALISALAIHGLFDSLLLPPSMIILFWSLAGIITATGQSERWHRRHIQAMSPMEVGQLA